MIWIIGGTVNAREIALLLKNKGHKVVVTTATEVGSQMAQLPDVAVVPGMLDIAGMTKLIHYYDITAVIDASHPFATEVSVNAIAAAQKSGIQYIRFERKTQVYPTVQYFLNYTELIDYLKDTTGNILLTIGSKNVGMFSKLSTIRLYARVLPVTSSIEQCEQAGLLPKNIIAMGGTFSVALNQAIMQEFNIRFLITKESGEEGGVIEKIQAANNLNIKVLMIRRPEIQYPLVFDNYNELIDRI